jgi:branched-chain amino acid transport system substrate-binding protein
MGAPAGSSSAGGVVRTAAKIGAAAIVATVAMGCSEPEPESTVDTRPTPAAADCAADLLTCARATTIADLVPDRPVAADGEPIVLGMINQENTAAGSFPELSATVEAGIAFVNEQLGGIDGRPLELVVCNTDFSAEGSTACGQQFVEAGVPAVLGGIDVFGTGIDTLADNGIPFVGGIPVSSQSAESPTSFQWSGGTWGATVAFAEYAATELDVERVAIVHGEFGSITESAEYGRTVLERHGVETQLVPFPILATDISSPLQAAAAGDPDALFVLAADTGCKPAFEGVDALDIDPVAFFVGACAAPAILDGVDPAVVEGTIFNVEGPVDRDEPNPDFDLYNAVVTEYGDGVDPVGAGTVSFRSFMNLLLVLDGLGADGIDPEAVTAALGAQVDAPSFMGHPSTCDRDQLEGLPALCSPQQILAEQRDGALVQLGSWIDVGAAHAGD